VPGDAPEVLVTNFNRHFTGVSATANAVIARHLPRYRLRLVGHPLPQAPPPLSYVQALAASRRPAPGRPFVLWHVRRNAEMLGALLARDLLRLPIRIVFTSAAQRLHSRLPRLLISRMDAVVTTSAKGASYVPRVAAIVPHGVDVDRFVPASDRARAWEATGWPGRAGVGIVGRIRPEKGTDLFVEAMLRLLPARPALGAVVIGRAKRGDGAFLRVLKQKIIASGLEDRFVFTDEMESDRLPAVLRGLSLLVAPPRYEGYGLTPLEAMASGVPVVATDTGAFRAMIEEGRCGCVVPLGDLDALTQAIASVVDDPATTERMGAAARERAVGLFSSEREAMQIAEVYERLWQGEKF
jgi:mannosyltransferase